MTSIEPSPSAPEARPPARPVQPAVGWAGWLLVVLALIAGLASGAWATQHWLGRQFQAQALEKQQAIERTLERTRTELLSARSRADSLSAQLVIERSTTQGLQSELQKAQTDLGAERDKVAFYEQLLPPGPQGSIAVRGLEIERQGPNLLYRVVIMRNSQAQQPFEGRLQFMAQGTRQGKAVQIELMPARAPEPGTPLQAGNQVAQAANAAAGRQVESNASDTAVSEQTVNDASGAHHSSVLDVAFEQFQRSTGLLQMPSGFLPRTVTLNVLEGDTVRASRSVKIGPVQTD